MRPSHRGLACAAFVFVAFPACSKPEPPLPVLGPDVPPAAMAESAPETGDVSKLYDVTKDDDVAGLDRKVYVVLHERRSFRRSRQSAGASTSPTPTSMRSRSSFSTYAVSRSRRT